jgi:uncharacterized membrane protein YdbT with pleckstrin-like domain
MPYPKKLLNDYETVALDLHPHWWYFAQVALALVASIVVGILVLVFLDGDVETVLTWVAIIAIALSVIWLIARYMKWATTNFVVTNDRVIFRSGVIAKSGIEIPLDRVNNVIFGQSLFERLIGAGDLIIESGGETGQQRFTDIRSPDRVQKLIHAQKGEKDRRRHGGGGTDVASQLEKLEGLLERGTISPEEFEAEKRKLLD